VPAAWWVFSSIGRNVTETVLTKADHTLVTTGPYRWLRHPLYATAAALLSVTLICLLLGVSVRSVGFAQAALALGESAKFAASDGAAGDQFGASLGISSGVGLVGAPSDDDNGTDSGAAYTSTTDANGVVTLSKLLASDGAAGDAFGSAVAIHRNILVVGAPAAGGTGVAYVFVRKGGRWVQKARLVATDGAVGDVFGSSVSVDGKTVVIGAPGKSQSTGAAYVFKRRGARWPQTLTLVASDGKKRDSFGMSVDVWGKTVIVGAPRNTKTGAAYVFVGTTQQAKLLASDGRRLDGFGQSVSAAGNTAAVGAPGDDDRGRGSGSAYTFGRVGKTWTQATKLVASDGRKGDAFGRSVTLLLNTVIVGAPFDDDNGANSGSAYAFVGLNETKLMASDGVRGDLFGVSVAMNGDGVLIGATKADGAVRDSGQVYAYTDDGGGGDGGGDDGEGEDPPPMSNPVTVSILGLRGSDSFSPNPVSPGGQTVMWRNDDGFTHRIVADDGSFDTGNLVAGAASEMIQPSAGGYHCSIHPSMVGSIGEAAGT
jgi:hypothetical protein